MAKKSIVKLFETRKGQMDNLLHRDFINNGIATLPVRISTYDDVIHPLSGHDLRRDRRTAGQLASIKVTFSKSFDETDYTKEDVDKLYSEIAQDVKKTIQEEEMNK